MLKKSVLWRRLDFPGHDACCLESHSNTLQLRGTAVFHHPDGPALISYLVKTDLHWHSLSAEVHGWIGVQELSFTITKDDSGNWTLNGKPSTTDLRSCIDLDLGFTPSTNTLPINRLKISTGEEAHVPAAWLDIESGSLQKLEQTYRLLEDRIYQYQSTSMGYKTILEFSPSGFVHHYPTLWHLEGEAAP